jgi:hypothetical protein
MYSITSEKLEKEKDSLRYLESTVLIEYLKSSIEILVNLKSEEDQSEKHHQ